MDDELGNCREVLHRLYHFLDGEVTPAMRAEIQQHLDDCPPCIEAFEFESELRLLVSRHCREVVPTELRLKIAQLIDHEQGHLGMPGMPGPSTSPGIPWE
jgi:mycothiol system anti-sigma-R factor